MGWPRRGTFTRSSTQQHAAACSTQGNAPGHGDCCVSAPQAGDDRGEQGIMSRPPPYTVWTSSTRQARAQNCQRGRWHLGWTVGRRGPGLVTECFSTNSRERRCQAWITLDGWCFFDSPKAESRLSSEHRQAMLATDRDPRSQCSWQRPLVGGEHFLKVDGGADGVDVAMADRSPQGSVELRGLLWLLVSHNYYGSSCWTSSTMSN